MTTSTVTKDPARFEIARRHLLAAKCREHPSHLMDQMRCVDEKTGEPFRFHLNDPTHPWFVQRDVLEHLIADQLVIVLKARQMGFTWICAGYQLASALLSPGTLHLVYRQKEEDAAKIVGRQWDMFQSLPEDLRFGVEVVTPRAGFRPSTLMRLRFPDGRISTIRGMASTESEGHGETAATVLVDEAAYIQMFRAIWKGILPVVGTVGKVMVVSTANGVSNEQTGEGSFFHRLWVTAEERGLTRVFYPWHFHPDRSQEWFDRSPEVQALDARERAEQYPASAEEAFRLSTDSFFDSDALDWYAQQGVAQPEERFTFVSAGPGRASRESSRTGLISVFEPPVEGVSYAIGCDISTGRGSDFSVAYVLSLAEPRIVAELRGKVDADVLAEQLHYLGRWYNTALMAPETAGGHGEAVIANLRDGRADRPAYPKMYRHRLESRALRTLAKVYGFPTNLHTRPLILQHLKQMVRERLLMSVPAQLHWEMGTFLRDAPPGHSRAGTWPRAMDGANDDCVMAAAIALEMYRQFGRHPEREARRPERKRKPLARVGDRGVVSEKQFEREFYRVPAA